MIFCVKHQFPTFLNSLKYRIRGYFASTSEHRGMNQTKRTTQFRIAVSSRGSVASSAAKSAARSTPPSAREKCHLPLRTRRHHQHAATGAQRSPTWAPCAFNRNCASSCLGRIHSPILRASACPYAIATLCVYYEPPYVRFCPQEAPRAHLYE